MNGKFAINVIKNEMVIFVSILNVSVQNLVAYVMLPIVIIMLVY